MYSQFNRQQPPHRAGDLRGGRVQTSRPRGDHPPQETVLRTPSYHRPVRVPANYSGNAVVDGEARPLGEGNAEEFLYVADRRPGGVPDTTPHFDGLPQVRELIPSVEHEQEPDKGTTIPMMLPASDSESTDTPTDSSPLRRLFDGSHFPFGHGMGSDEWLLLGLILFLLHESDGERGDLDETLLLLGLLLFCG